MNFISPTAKISSLADIEESVRGSRLTIEDNVTIDAFVKIKFVGGTKDIAIGKNCYLNSGVVIYSGNGVVLGEGVLVAANTTFAATNHAFQDRDQSIIEQRFMPSRGGITVGDDVWIGANCVLLDGTVIGRGCVVGAHSLVQGELPPYTVWAGNPLRMLGERR